MLNVQLFAKVLALIVLFVISPFNVIKFLFPHRYLAFHVAHLPIVLLFHLFNYPILSNTSLFLNHEQILYSL